MLTLQEFIEAFGSEVGSEISELVRDEEIARWVNQGQSRLDFYVQDSATLAWAAGDLQVALPADFHHAEELRADASSVVPAANQWGGALVFTEPALAAGGAALRYYANYPAITTASPSALPTIGDDGILSYCLYRFYKRLASSRADYRRYSTLTQANAVDISELDALSERHFADFQDTKDTLAELLQTPSFYFEG